MCLSHIQHLGGILYSVISILNLKFGGLDRIRTCDLQFRKLAFYPTELRVLHFISQFFQQADKLRCLFSFIILSQLFGVNGL